MPDKKPIDEEIVKAFKICNNLEDGYCSDCTYEWCDRCIREVARNTLALINRLQAENERLNNNISAMAVTMSNSAKATRHEAYKECIEKVKEEIAEALKSNYTARAEKENKEINLYLDNLFCHYCSGKIDCLRGLDDFLDNLLKELKGTD